MTSSPLAVSVTRFGLLFLELDSLKNDGRFFVFVSTGGDGVLNTCKREGDFRI
jgi:hypothetical protein